MSIGSIVLEDFGRLFQSEDFEKIYYCTSEEFQQLISLEQFLDSAVSFNKGVNN